MSRRVGEDPLYRLHQELMQAHKDPTGRPRLYPTDTELLRQHYRFLLDDDGEAEGWEARMVRAYHERLYKEYCLADLSRTQEPGAPIGLRWRSEAEVVAGKGQFVCGALGCHEAAGLTSWEVNFGYAEGGVQRNALVKLRLCGPCSGRLPSGRRRSAPPSSGLLP